MNDSELFITYINDNYDRLKYKYVNFCNEHNYQFDADIFQDTIVKCYDRIQKQKTLQDTTPQGIENYFFMAYKTNMMRERQYSRVAKKDDNVSDVSTLYEDWYNENNSSAEEKLKKDLWIDYSTLYILKKVEDNFPSDFFYLFRLKYLIPNMTYKELATKTGMKGVRQKVLSVKNYLKEHITKEEIQKAFYEKYSDLL